METIRIATAEDLPAIVEIYNQAVATRIAVGDLTPVTVDMRREWMLAHLHPKYPIFVAERGGELTGWCSLSAYRPGRMALAHTAELSYFVHRAHLRQGVATRLIERTLAAAKQAGIRRVFAILMELNHPSRALLTRLGFEQWAYLPGVAEIDGKECGQLYQGRAL